MSRVAAVLNRRVVLIVFTLCAVAAALVLDPPRSSAAASCLPGERTIYYTYYYPNSNYTQSVGVCRDSCHNGVTCTGQITQYFILFPAGCC